ncbi:hypothetical protein DXG03_006679 [Asterophora parasitica]|uniref:HMG box domain-containing protein n=1 Tax=Asterophora parasitica TaxID=117018 RepID=A0A9P7K9F9_9AGAR|nr:hypothetical protein DXG03_006679 [Asterophora parasitica]
MSYIPRPLNSFMLYRADMAPTLPASVDGKQGTISKIIAQRWRSETSEVRAEYGRRALKEKSEHEEKYPGYKYRPRTKAMKEMERAMGLKAPPRTRRTRTTRGADSVHTGPQSATSHYSLGSLSEDSRLVAQNNDVSRDHSAFFQQNLVHDRYLATATALDNESELDLQHLDAVDYDHNTFGDSDSQPYANGAIGQLNDFSGDFSYFAISSDWDLIPGCSSSSLDGPFGGTQIDPVTNKFFEQFAALYGTYEDVTAQETYSSQSAAFWSGSACHPIPFDDAWSAAYS